MEDSFHYSGPKTPSKARGCMACVAAVSGLCANQPPHVEVVESCGLCQVAAAGVCGAHGRGVARALDEHEEGLTGAVASRFKAARAVVDSELSLIADTCWVQVDVSLHSGLNVDFKGDRTGVAPQHLTVSVTQLET